MIKFCYIHCNLFDLNFSGQQNCSFLQQNVDGKTDSEESRITQIVIR